MKLRAFGFRFGDVVRVANAEKIGKSGRLGLIMGEIGRFQGKKWVCGFSNFQKLGSENFASGIYQNRASYMVGSLWGKKVFKFWGLVKNPPPHQVAKKVFHDLESGEIAEVLAMRPRIMRGGVRAPLGSHKGGVSPLCESS